MASKVTKTSCTSVLVMVNHVSDFIPSGNRLAVALEAVPEESSIPTLSYNVNTKPVRKPRSDLAL
jgi:hypothetical protein